MNTNGYSLAVDIWSLGCTILEMATSKPPWSQLEGVRNRIFRKLLLLLLFFQRTLFVRSILKCLFGTKWLRYVGFNRWQQYSKLETAEISLKYLKAFGMMQRVL
jgi:serine/threonine protein kinase